MTKDEFIKYFVGVVQRELEQNFPNFVNKEYPMPEQQMIDCAFELVSKRFNHIKEEISTAYITKQKGEKK